MEWPHVQQPMSENILKYLAGLDPKKDIKKVASVLPLSDDCLKNIRVAGLLLKKASLAGLTLHDVGLMLYR